MQGQQGWVVNVNLFCYYWNIPVLSRSVTPTQDLLGARAPLGLCSLLVMAISHNRTGERVCGTHEPCQWGVGLSNYRPERIPVVVLLITGPEHSSSEAENREDQVHSLEQGSPIVSGCSREHTCLQNTAAAPPPAWRRPARPLLRMCFDAESWEQSWYHPLNR